MLSAQVNSSSQLVYDQGIDFAVSQDASGSNVVTPLNNDTRDSFLILQHAVNRLATILKLPSIPEDGIIAKNLFTDVFVIANSDEVVSTATTFLDSVPRNQPFNKIVHLGQFRTQATGPALANFVNTSILDLAKRARLWASLFSALADTIWWSSLSDAPAPLVPTRSSKIGLVVAAAIGWAIGIGTAALIFRRRLQHTTSQ